MAFENLLGHAKRLALQLVGREIERILAKGDLPKDVTAEATPEGVVLSGKKLKRRAVTDPRVRDVAR